MHVWLLRSYTRFSGTCYGLSAAIGKTGAAIGTEVFTPIQDAFGKRWSRVYLAFTDPADDSLFEAGLLLSLLSAVSLA